MESTGDELSGAWNFRDVAEETGIAPGRFFRSGELSRLDGAGQGALARFGIGDVADLRSLREVERRGSGQVPDGITVHLLPFRGPSADLADAPHENVFEKMMVAERDDGDVGEVATRHMTEEYQRFPALPGAQTAVREVISLLADRRSVIAHCVAGKDRTGFAVALVLETIGVAQEAIVTDFLRSNAAVPRLRENILESIRTRSGETPTPAIVTFAESRLNDDLLGVREEYLVAAKRTIDIEYGSTAGYLEAIGVTTDQVTRLREALLT